MSKADLHLHSRFSNRPADWVLRRFEMPDGSSDPKDLYRKLRAAGMDFFTLTDHNRIEGCLEVAGLPGVFLSEEVTAFFPEDRCPVHLLVWGITEAQHREMQSLAGNLYELRDYLLAEDLAHAVAHPVYRLDEKFGVAHLEKLAVLFRCFERVNGLRDAMLGEMAGYLFGNLTPGRLAEWAEKHRLEPRGEEPWKKVFVAGSDDHAGLFAGRAWTETPPARSVGELLGHLKAGRCEARGEGGEPLQLSHGVYKTVYAYARARFNRGQAANLALLERMFSRFMEGNDPTEFTWGEKLGFLGQGLLSGKIFELAKPANQSLWRQFAESLGSGDVKAVLASRAAGVKEPERRAFIAANLFANQLLFRFFTGFLQELQSGNVIESIQQIAAVVPVAVSLGPYLYGFLSQVPSRRWLREVSGEMTGGLPDFLRNENRAWFTDTLEDVNGVATTIRKLAAAGVADGKRIVVATCRESVGEGGIPIRNFRPIGEFELPEYELQKLSFPPILEIFDWVQRERFTELIISTPGPVGLTALFAAKAFGLRTAGIYHTDFPQYVRILTDDSFLETLTWNYMHWFYSQLDVLYVNSEQYRKSWVARGIPAERVRILPRGLDGELFRPGRRRERFFVSRGARPGRPVALYVGRVSKEKDLDVLAEAWLGMRRGDDAPELAVVGDGPYLAEMKRRLPGAVFTGYLSGTELAEAFASADLFAFPSTTDTFGNVILEAMASGLPCVVSDQGGPRELVRDGVDGFVTRGGDAAAFRAALARLAGDPALREKMRAAALESVKGRDWQAAFRRFWAETAD
jgi:glycosyltransferase involved in cell wall biosynthesis